MTNYRKIAPGIGEQHKAIHGFRCKDCRGKAYADGGRVRVSHRQDCAIFLRMILTHPNFYATLDKYRKQPA